MYVCIYLYIHVIYVDKWDDERGMFESSAHDHSSDKVVMSLVFEM